MTDAAQERLRQLATETARARHNDNADIDGYGARNGHVGEFQTCPHQDCVLARAASFPESDLAHWHLCADHQPDRWESDGTCPLCEAERLKAAYSTKTKRME